MKVQSQTVSKVKLFEPIRVNLEITIETLDELVGIKEALNSGDLMDSEKGEVLIEKIEDSLRDQL